MSYDLYLSSQQLTREAFFTYFKDRPNYRDGGWYANDDTGVYFGFSLEAGEDYEDAPEMLRREHVAFNLNYYRPHVFGLEAEPEVTAFVAAFECNVHDPQSKGMGDGPYSPGLFLGGWNAGNQFAYEVMTKDGAAGPDDVVAADADIERIWRWNFARRSLQSRFEELFLPRVSWVKLSDGSPAAYAVWGEGVVTAIPDCASHVVLAREPRAGLASLFKRPKRTIEAKLVAMADVAVLDGCRWRDIDGVRVLVAPERTPPSRAVRAAFDGAFPGLEAMAKGVAFDHVLNASLMPAAPG
jgi:hypothetical protein